jgi:hypothetical protein
VPEAVAGRVLDVLVSDWLWKWARAKSCPFQPIDISNDRREIALICGLPLLPIKAVGW